MDKKLIGKYVMMGLGMALTAAASFVESKNQDATIKETVIKEVAKHFEGQAKES